MTSSKKTSTTFALPLVGKLIAEALSAGLQPLPYAVQTMDDEEIGKVSAKTLQLAAFAHDLRRRIARAKADLQFIYDTDQMTNAVGEVNRLSAQLALVNAVFNYQLYEESRAWTHAQPTIREGGVVVYTPLAADMHDDAITDQVYANGIGASRRFGGGTYEDLVPPPEQDLGQFLSMALEALRGVNAKFVQRSEADSGHKANGRGNGHSDGGHLNASAHP